ncbi:RDD family protein [Lutibacter sp. B2]|nr:RDD family protein [Lutibacter sp. B2]
MQTSSPMKRFFAYFLDAIVMGLILLIFMVMGAATESVGLILLSVVISWGVQMFFWTKGTSVGKSMLKMSVVNKDTGEKLGFIHMLIREIIGKFISGLILSLGYIWILIDNDKQGWHDKFVSSIVVDVK